MRLDIAEFEFDECFINWTSQDNFLVLFCYIFIFPISIHINSFLRLIEVTFVSNRKKRIFFHFDTSHKKYIFLKAESKSNTLINRQAWNMRKVWIMKGVNYTFFIC